MLQSAKHTSLQKALIVLLPVIISEFDIKFLLHFNIIPLKELSQQITSDLSF